MTKETKWHGPHESPFVAVSKCLADQNIDTCEFSTFGMWNMAGEYPFFSRPLHFIQDLIAYIGEQYRVVVQLRPDGFYAAYDEAEDEPTSYDLKMVGDKHAVFFKDNIGETIKIAEFMNLDDAISFKRSKES